MSVILTYLMAIAMTAIGVAIGGLILNVVLASLARGLAASPSQDVGLLSQELANNVQ